MIFHISISSDKVQALMYCNSTKQLLSAGEDCIMAFWDMDVKRTEVRKVAL